MKLIKIRQHFPRDSIAASEIAPNLHAQLARCGVSLPLDGKIAIAVGSRGIANLVSIVRTTVQWVQAQGGRPFIVPSMGSHGGATAAGQQAILEEYGIIEHTVGAPIRSSMEVVELPPGDLNHHVYMDKQAYEADAVIVINRVKLHTAFHGPTESGLLKMCVIGLGKHEGALEIHRYGSQGLRNLIPPTARHILRHSKIRLGIAVAENAYDETALLKVVPPSEFETTDTELLRRVKANMPHLPVDQLDVLIIDEFGKHISGTGMDVNIIGRMRIAFAPEPDSPRITSIILRELSDLSHGNANGMGLADVITRRFFEKIDFQATYENVTTTGFLERGKLPVVADTDRQALEYALKPCGLKNPEDATIIQIQHTLKLDEFWASPRVVEEIKERPGIEVTEEIRKFLIQ